MQILVEVGVFQMGLATLIANFRRNGTLPTYLFSYQKTRVITLSCGIKILAVCFCHFVTKHTRDVRTDPSVYRYYPLSVFLE